ncbi:MAG: hypothetical protein HYY85_12055 [Deltaproteobacteria bacterium]|nr:hypothetical protein [Deltaproteobacteria bacterium]
MTPLNVKGVALATGLFLGVTYILCTVLFGLLVPGGQALHQLYPLIFPGFTWITPGSFVLGLVESVVYGLYIGGGFSLAYNLVLRRPRPA